MAARKTKHQDWKFYVYEIGESEAPLYIGKGSGNRLSAQQRKHGAEGREVALFWCEDDAYSAERLLIKERKPLRNRHPGGNGSRVKKPTPRRRFGWELEIERVGSRVYAARELLKFDLRGYLSASKVDAIRRVAYGTGA